MNFWNDSQGHVLSPLNAPWGYPPGGRLTLTTATPVTSSDVSGVNMIYYTPYTSNRISLWNGVYWVPLTFTELSMDLHGFAISQRPTVTGTTTASSPVITGITSTSNLAIGDLLDLGNNFLGDAAIVSVDSASQVTMSKNCLAGGGGSNTLYFYCPLYDFFASLDANQNVVLTTQPWTNATTRATNVIFTDGLYTLASDKTKLYLGTIQLNQYHLAVAYATDAAARRGVWNAYNRVRRQLLFLHPTGSWAYSGGYRQAGGNQTAMLWWVNGMVEESMSLEVICCINSPQNTAGNVSIGLDNIKTPSADQSNEVSAGVAGGMIGISRATYNHYVAPGGHYASWLENVRAPSVTFYGSSGAAYTSSLRGVMQG